MANVRALQGLQGTVGQPTAQVINGSLKFKSASSQYLSSTSTFQNTKSYEMTFSFWLKRCAPTAVKETQYILKTNQEGTIFFDNGNSDQLAFNLRGSSGTNFFTYTSAKLRDYNAWYHVVVALNLGSGTQSQRFKCYINNVEQTMTNTSYPSNAYHTGGTWYIGSYNGSSHYPDYYLSNFYCISGQTLDPSYFGFTDPQTNTWRPKKYTGTFTFDNSFYLPLDNEDDFGKDKSGEGNHFTQNNFSGTSINPDVVKDSPSGAVFGGRSQTGITTTSSAPANYATYNANDNHGNTLSNGNLTASNTAGNWYASFGSIPSSDGRHYFEVTPTTLTTTCAIGVYVGNGRTDFNGNYPYDANTYMIHQNGYIYHAASTASYQTTYSANDTVGVAVDSKNRKVWISVNGSYVSGENPTTGIGGLQDVTGVGAMPDGEIYPVVSNRSAVADINFGQKPFKYAPPQGYSPLNSASARPNKVVPRPDQYVGVVTYTSNSGSAYEVSGLEFSPDLIITKNRDNASGDWNLQDTVCGITSVLTFNANYAASAQTDNLHTVTANGFKIGTGARFNSSSQKICSWFWKAGGPKIGGQGANEFWIDGKNYASAAAAGLDDGTITPVSASVGTKQGFSIVRWNTESLSGTQSLDTGLTEAPEFVITKVLDQADDWLTFHKDLSSTETLIINGNRAKLSNAAYAHTFNSDGTISGMPVGGSNWWISSRKYVFYSWHSVPGLQKFGKYKGNSSNDGPFVELGFRPSVLLIKRYDGAGNWILVDNKRNKVNVVDKQLLPNSSGADYTEAAIDFVSNGFKVRLGSSGHVNIYDFVYAAWAEAPASNLFGGQSNAR